MSQLEYYGATPVSQLPHKSALSTWGVLLIVCGGLSALMAVFATLGAVMMASGAIPNASGQSPAVIFMGVGVYVVAAVALIALGIGSLKGRRWVRPLMMVGSILTMISGLASLPTFVEGAIRSVGKPGANPAAAGLPAGFEAGTLACSGFFVLLLAEVLPAVLLWFYGRASVKSTLDLLDPKPRWTDRCPIPVLGWSIGCVLFSLGLCFALFKGVFPFFNQVLAGMPGLLIPVMLGVMMCVGGILCYRQSRIGLVLTVAATLVLAGSYATFAFVGDKSLFLDLMTQGMPANTREMTARMSGGMMITPAVMYSLAVVYALWLSGRMKTPIAATDVHLGPQA